MRPRSFVRGAPVSARSTVRGSPESYRTMILVRGAGPEPGGRLLSARCASDERHADTEQRCAKGDEHRTDDDDEVRETERHDSEVQRCLPCRRRRPDIASLVLDRISLLVENRIALFVDEEARHFGIDFAFGRFERVGANDARMTVIVATSVTGTFLPR